MNEEMKPVQRDECPKDDMYTYEILLRETKLRKVSIQSQRDLNLDEIKLFAAKGEGEQLLSMLDHVEILNVEKKPNFNGYFL